MSHSSQSWGTMLSPVWRLRQGCCAEEAQEAGVQVAVCSTSNERSVGQVVDVLIGGEAAPKIKIYAGTARTLLP